MLHNPHAAALDFDHGYEVLATETSSEGNVQLLAEHGGRRHESRDVAGRGQFLLSDIQLILSESLIRSSPTEGRGLHTGSEFREEN